MRHVVGTLNTELTRYAPTCNGNLSKYVYYIYYIDMYIMISMYTCTNVIIVQNFFRISTELFSYYKRCI